MTDSVTIFFYGLFMDKSILASKQIYPKNEVIGYVEGYELRIGDRASLIPNDQASSYGLLMEIDRAAVTTLYSAPGVVDYIPEYLEVSNLDGVPYTALCYNLPASDLAGANPSYAAELAALTVKLGFPAEYSDSIASQAT